MKTLIWKIRFALQIRKLVCSSWRHSWVETTAGYCHAEALSVRSPLDVVPVMPGNVVPFVMERRAA